MKICSVCGAPKSLTRSQSWLDNGTIVETKDTSKRTVFFENDNIIEIFRIIEELLGLSIEKIIIESQRKATYDYVDRILPSLIQKILRVTSYRPVVNSLTKMGKSMGLGNVSLLDMQTKRREGDFVKLGTDNIFFLPSFCGMVTGALEVVSGHDCSVSYQETSPGYYEVTTFFSTHPKELVERLPQRGYSSRPGEVALQKCPGCGAPEALADYSFDLEAGVITSKTSGRRMIFDGAAEYESIFDELENELGEDIPQVIIEAQRRFVKSGFYGTDEVQELGEFREHLALRGLGNLKGVSFEDDRLRLRIENPCLHLLLVGLAQGSFELVFGREGRIEWELTGEGDLIVEVT